MSNLRLSSSFLSYPCSLRKWWFDSEVRRQTKVRLSIKHYLLMVPSLTDWDCDQRFDIDSDLLVYIDAFGGS